MGGKESYWWPNKPYSDDYTAVMHTLRLKIEPTQNQSQTLPEPAMGEAATGGGGGGGGEDGDSPPLPLIHQHDAFIRFGFVEWGESRDGGFYTVNGVRINFIGDATPEAGQSDYDAYSTTEGWASHAGAVESFRRYMRLGITANRIHQSTPTQVMMSAADEVGFPLNIEPPLRGGCNSRLSMIYCVQSLQEVVAWARSHPSTWLYSLVNEATLDALPGLIDAMGDVDTTRPLCWNDNRESGPSRVHGRVHPTLHASAHLHYINMGCPADVNYAGGSCIPRKPGQLVAFGEVSWCAMMPSPAMAPLGLEGFAASAVRGRLYDTVYTSGWDLLNYWPNLIEGADYKRHGWREPLCLHRDRRPTVDGWGSPVVEWIQKAFHPYLILDEDSYKEQPIYMGGGWGKANATVQPGGTMTRHVVLFNDGLRDDDDDALFTLRWELRWEGADGTLGGHGEVDPVSIQPGERGSISFSFVVPVPPLVAANNSSTHVSSRTSLLYVVMASWRGGSKAFEEDRVRVPVAAPRST